MPFDADPALECPRPEPAAVPTASPAQAPPPQAPRGRPWTRGQSGNPAGRPARSASSEARRAATVAHAVIDRNAAALTRKLVELALQGDPTALRLCFDRLTPPAGPRRACCRCRRQQLRTTLASPSLR